jgi:hypothetical protein
MTSGAHLDDTIEALAAGTTPTEAEAAHLAGCPTCRSRLALAVRLERILTEWPVSTPAPDFAARVLAATRRDSWRAEQVVDWGFNAAIAAGLALAIAGVVSLVWVLGSAAEPAQASSLVAEAAREVLTRMRGQATVVGTATMLLATGLGAWWWAEEHWRW